MRPHTYPVKTADEVIRGQNGMTWTSSTITGPSTMLSSGASQTHQTQRPISLNINPNAEPINQSQTQKLPLSSFKHLNAGPGSYGNHGNVNHNGNARVMTYKSVGLERQLERAFMFFDRDKNGTIPVCEIRNMVSQLDLEVSAGALDQILERIPPEHEVDVEEFKALLKSALGCLNSNVTDSTLAHMRQTVMRAKQLALESQGKESLHTQMTNLFHMQHHYRLISSAQPSVDSWHYSHNSKCYHSLLSFGQKGYLRSVNPSRRTTGRMLPLERMHLILTGELGPKKSCRPHSARMASRGFKINACDSPLAMSPNNRRPQTACGVCEKSSVCSDETGSHVNMGLDTGTVNTPSHNHQGQPESNGNNGYRTPPHSQTNQSQSQTQNQHNYNNSIENTPGQTQAGRRSSLGGGRTSLIHQGQVSPVAAELAEKKHDFMSQQMSKLGVSAVAPVRRGSIELGSQNLGPLSQSLARRGSLTGGYNGSTIMQGNTVANVNSNSHMMNGNPNGAAMSGSERRGSTSLANERRGSSFSTTSQALNSRRMSIA